MTFYNIIFGVLFVGACRQLLLLGEDPLFWTAATIAILIFNDVVNTSDALEGAGAAPYTLFMKLVDLANFFLLGLALMALKPDDNPFGAKAPKQLAAFMQPVSIWLLLLIYWGLAVVWNWSAGLYTSQKWPLFLVIASHAMLVPFAGMFYWVSRVRSPDEIPEWAQVAVFACPALYMLVAKPLAKKP